MAHGIWNGNISFGLVNIPVSLNSAETHDKVHFHMLDKKDKSPIKYKTVNGSSQKEVPRSQIVKGYEYKKGNFVLISDDDFKRADVEATKTIDIQAFVDVSEVDPEYFERPYFVQPVGKVLKSYALLREALRKSNKIGIAKVVLSGKQHLCALMVRDEYLILELLRFAHQIKKPDNKAVPSTDLKKLAIKDSEIKMAQQLIDQMSQKFNPWQYKDDYQNNLMKFITNKIKHGSHIKARVLDEDTEKNTEESDPGKVIDFMSLLKKSVDQSGSKAGHRGAKKAARA